MTKEEFHNLIESEFNNYDIIESGELSHQFGYSIRLKMKDTCESGIIIYYYDYSNDDILNCESNHISIIIGDVNILKLYDNQLIEHIRIYKQEIDKYVYNYIKFMQIIDNFTEIELNSEALIRDNKINKIL